MSSIDRWQFSTEKARSWRGCHTVALGAAYEHKPMGTTLDRTGARRPWSIHKLTFHFLIWKLRATLTVWTDR